MRSPRSRELGDLLEAARMMGSMRWTLLALGRARDLVDGLLGAVDELLHLADVAVALGGDPLAGGDELANAPLLVDAFARRCSTCATDGHGVDELRQVGAAAHLREPLAIAQHARDADDVDRRALGRELDAPPRRCGGWPRE